MLRHWTTLIWITLLSLVVSVAKGQEAAPAPSKSSRPKTAKQAPQKETKTALPSTAPRYPPITRETAAAEIAKARESLKGLDPVPSDISSDTLTALRSRMLAYRLEDATFGLWEATARPDDLLKVDSGGFGPVEFVTRGAIALQPPPEGGRHPKPSAALYARATGISLFEKSEPEELARKAKEVHAQGKQMLALPTGERLLQWGPDKVAELAKAADVFIIQAERWFYEDKSADKKDFIGNVLEFSKVIRKANPQCRILIELGRRLDRGGGTADQWLHGLALLYAKDPNSFDGFYPFITRQQTNDPKQGFGALRQVIAWLRVDVDAKAM